MEEDTTYCSAEWILDEFQELFRGRLGSGLASQYSALHMDRQRDGMVYPDRPVVLYADMYQLHLEMSATSILSVIYTVEGFAITRPKRC